MTEEQTTAFAAAIETVAEDLQKLADAVRAGAFVDVTQVSRYAEEVYGNVYDDMASSGLLPKQT